MDCAPADIFFSFDKDTLTDLKTPLNGFRATLFSQGVIFDICFEENYWKHPEKTKSKSQSEDGWTNQDRRTNIIQDVTLVVCSDSVIFN